MYYFEGEINGVIMYKTTPNGEWSPVIYPTYRYVWLNIKDGSFSNSWDKSESTSSRASSDEQYQKEMEKLSTDAIEGWKLIKYQTVNDNSFEFSNLMTLK